MSQVKLNLSASIPKQIDQGTKVANMTKLVITGTEPLIVALELANGDLAAKQLAALTARQNYNQAYTELYASAQTQRTAYGNVGGLVQSNSGGDASFIQSCGLDVRASASPYGPIGTAPTKLRTRVNGTPGRILLSWAGVSGARLYEVQSSTDLSGATGWTSAAEMPSATKLGVEGLSSGTKYALRVRALGKGLPGPWSSLVQQMAP
jgi:hypothetical protein